MTLVDYLVPRPFDLNPRFQSLFPRMDFPEQALRVDLPASAAYDGTIEGTFDSDNSLLVSAVTITCLRSMLCQWAY